MQQFHEPLPKVEQVVPPSRLAKLAAFCSRTAYRFGNGFLDFLLWLPVHLRLRSESSAGKAVGLNVVVKQQLETSITGSNSSVLPHGKDVPRTGGGSLRNEEVTAGRPNEDSSYTYGEKIMPVALLQPRTYLHLRFPVPQRGFTRRGLINYKVEASLPVDTYVFDEEGLQRFASGNQEFFYYGGFPQREQHNQEIRLPFQGHWYLVINNPHPEPVAVYYDVTG
jgi:hypothetical protein